MPESLLIGLGARDVITPLMEFEWAADAEPTDLRWEDGHTRVGITWNDDHVSTYDLRYLRRICPCAICKDAHAHPPIRTTAPSGASTAGKKAAFNILSPPQAQLAKATATAKEAYPIGRYAIGFKWSDGHDEGIYSYRYLRA
ncbi:MAG: DUF971 family protein, partial [Myxococcota bacterium]